MSYPKRITLKIYERQVFQSVKDCGAGIVRGGAESHVLFRMRSIISLYNLDLSAGSNRAGDVVVWARGRWKTANEATTGVGKEVRIINIEDTRPKRFTVDKMLGMDEGLRDMQRGNAVVDYENMAERALIMARTRWNREKEEGVAADLTDIDIKVLSDVYPSSIVDMFNIELDKLRKENKKGSITLPYG